MIIEDVNQIKRDLLEYLDIRLDQIRLHTAEGLSRFFSRILIIAIVGYLLFFILLCLSFAAAFLIGSLLDSVPLGFLMVALCYALFLGLFFIFRKQIIEKPVIKAFVQLLFPKLTGDEEQEL
jgi:hypothetical protein